MNTDSFANFGIRFLEILSLQFADQVIRSEALAIVTGLLRTNDYETVAQCLSFISVVAESANIAESQRTYAGSHRSKEDTSVSVKDVLNKRILVLIMKTVVKSPEVEYMHFVTQIVNLALAHKDLRAVVV